MREVAFIKQNKEKWLAVEEVLNKRKEISPDELADLYIHLLGDLSFSQTYYPKSNTTIYLNFLVTQIYQKIYKTKRIEKNRFLYFFKEEAPKLSYKYRKTIYFSFILFFFFVFLGAISVHSDENYIRIILGDSYVNDLVENIKNGEPMAVYKSGSNWGSAIAITIHNIKVSFRVFIYGITAGILTFYLALYNAMMVGAFQYFCYQQGVLSESLKAIWLHGAMEIFSIVIATASGFILTQSFLFPRTYSRILSFKTGFKDALKLLLSTLPFFIVAGFIEGFVTRYSAVMPLWLTLFIILGSLSFITYYFLIYPWKFKFYK